MPIPVSHDAVAIEVSADPELHGGTLERIAVSALLVVACVAHPGESAGVLLCDGREHGPIRLINDPDRELAEDSVVPDLDVFVPPVLWPKHLV